jgi:Holliday junction resolvase RusA-like endonuclease
VTAWSVDLPGQPASGNELGIVRKYRRTKTGASIQYPGIQKRQAVQDYQDGIIPLIRVAKPSRWAPAGLLRLTYDLYLARDMDCDNISKTVGDAIKVAIQIDDKLFMPTFRTKVVGVKEPHIVVTIEPFELCSGCGR